VVPEKQGLKQYAGRTFAWPVKSLSSGSRKTRIETEDLRNMGLNVQGSKQWFQKNKD